MGSNNSRRCKKLRVLDLRGCVGVTDAGLAHLPALVSLERLKLRNPGVTDAGLKPISKLDEAQRTVARGYRRQRRRTG